MAEVTGPESAEPVPVEFDPTGRGVSEQVHIRASAARVWDLISDIGTPCGFSPELRTVRWCTGSTGPALGARFVGTNEHPKRGEWQTTSEIVSYQPERSFGWRVGEAESPVSFWTFEMHAEAGVVTLRESATFGSGTSGISPLLRAHPEKAERIVARRLQDWQEGIRSVLAGITELAERAGEEERA
ncbi:MAG: SRPBCC family protein [Sciscionella sp.]